MKKILFAVIVVALAVVVFRLATSPQTDILEERTAVKVNGDPISTNEFKMLLLDKAANTYNYFKQKHNADDEEDFWTRSYGGEVPIEYARKKALEEAVRIKIEQKLAKEKGLIQDFSYAGFRESLEAENKRRKESMAQGRVIYGPQQYGEREYFRYLHNNLLPKLKRKLAERELAISEEEVVKHYELNRETHFKRDDDIKVKIISADAITDKGPLKKESGDKVRSRLETIKARLDKGEALANILKTAGTDARIRVAIVEKTFSAESSRTDNVEYPLTVREAKKLSPGTSSGIVEEHGYLLLVKCMERHDMGYQELEEVKDIIKTNLLDKNYEEMINRLVQEAKVEVVQDVYRTTSVR